MADKAMKIYEEYKKRVERLQPNRVEKNLDTIDEYIQNSKKLNGISKTQNGCGRFDGTYKRSDTGEVFELFINEFSGFYSRIVIFENEESWREHKEALPFNIYFEW